MLRSNNLSHASKYPSACANITQCRPNSSEKTHISKIDLKWPNHRCPCIGLWALQLKDSSSKGNNGLKICKLAKTPILVGLPSLCWSRGSKVMLLRCQVPSDLALLEKEKKCGSWIRSKTTFCSSVCLEEAGYEAKWCFWAPTPLCSIIVILQLLTIIQNYPELSHL